MLIKEQGYKINFIDSNDVFVGFDNMQSCCEDFGYCITEGQPAESSEDCQESALNLEGYVFDTDFFNESSFDGDSESATAIFKLVQQGLPDLYLTLYNSHNGYYSHGFDATVGGEHWQEGRL